MVARRESQPYTSIQTMDKGVFTSEMIHTRLSTEYRITSQYYGLNHFSAVAESRRQNLTFIGVRL